MSNEYAVAFDLISTAGNSRSNSMLALQAARAGDSTRAIDLLEQAEADLLAAHHIQTALVQQEASGEPVAVNIILVHAQDHLTSAMLIKDLATEFVHVYEQLETLRAQGVGA